MKFWRELNYTMKVNYIKCNDERKTIEYIQKRFTESEEVEFVP